MGATAEAQQLRSVADDLRTELYIRAPELIAATSRAEWFRAETHLTAGLGLLRYHKQAAQPLEHSARVSRLLAVRDALMAQNLLDIRRIEARRGPTLVYAHNLHLQRGSSRMRMPELDLDWFCAGAIVGSLVGEQYTFIAGSLGRSAALDLPDPEPDTYEGLLQARTSGWGLSTADAVGTAHRRDDTSPERGYFPLEEATVGSADAILHISEGTTAAGAG